MPNSKNAATEAYEAILALGGPGSGKTSQIWTLPGRKFAYIFDPRALASLNGLDMDYELFTPQASDLDTGAKTLKKDGPQDKSRRKIEPRVYVDWEAHFEEAMGSGLFKSYDWLIFDSGTMFCEALMDRILYLNQRGAKQPQQDDWAAQITTLRHVFRLITSLEINLFWTGHTELRQDELTRKVFGQIMLPGRLRTLAPLMFSNIFAFHCNSGEEEESFLMQTRPDRVNPVIRTTLDDLAFEEDVTIKDWSKPEQYGLGALLRKHGLLSTVGARASAKSPSKR